MDYLAPPTPSKEPDPERVMDGIKPKSLLDSATLLEVGKQPEQAIAGSSKVHRTAPPSVQIDILRQELHQLKNECTRAQRGHQKEALTWQNQISKAEGRAKECERERTILQSDLMAAQRAARQASEKEKALRLAFDRAEQDIGSGADKGQRYNALQRKVEELEDLHDESKQKHRAEVDRLRLQLEEAQKLAAERKDQLNQDRKHSKSSDQALEDLKATLLTREVELEKLRDAHQEVLAASSTQALKDQTKIGKVSQLLQETKDQGAKDIQARDATIKRLQASLEEERKRHQAARAKFLDLQMALDIKDGQATSRTQELEKVLAGARKEIQELEADREALQISSTVLADDLVEARQTISYISTEYGRLVHSTVSKDRYEQMTTECARLQILVISLEADVEDQVAQLKELGYLVQVGAEATSALTLALEESETEVEAVSRLYRQALSEERLAGQLHAQRSEELMQLERLASKLSQGTLLDRCRSLDLDVDRLCMLMEHYHGQADDFATTVETMAAAHTEALANSELLICRLVDADVAHRQLQAESKAATTARETVLDELRTRNEELKLAKSTNAKLQTKLEETVDELRDDVIKAESAFAEALEKATAGEKFVMQSRMCEEGLRADINRLMEQLEHAGRYEAAYLRLIQEVGVLVSRNALAEEEANKLSQVNVEILSHTNASQKILYVDQIRRELAETKQKLIATTVDRDTAFSAKAALSSELATYKSLTTAIELKPKTHLTRVQRAPLAITSRSNTLMEKSHIPRAKGDGAPMTLDDLR
ncbi:hypothetical protein FRB98_000523 [Tulasnella sp. 332]|nr:hypothetical protein FRB98_000523 [Tulasnella sp. 332]